jgi:hypothetical protein
MIAFLRKINRALRGAAVRVAGIVPVIRMVRDPVQSKTRFPEERLKSRGRVLAENLLWLMKYGEVNRFYWLYGLDRAEGDSPNDYIPYTDFKKIRNRRNRIAGVGHYFSDYTVILKDKFIFNRVLSSLDFPTPEVVAVSVDGLIYWLDSGRETGMEELLRVDELDLFCKTLLGECADGVFHLTGGRGRLLCDGEEMALAELERITSGAFLLQERVIQHPEMSRLYPHSINTIRLVTIRNRTPRPRVFAASIRTGASGSTRDNWAVGGLSGGIDVETGRLSPLFDFRPGKGGRVRRHPDTGIIFGEFTVPMFDRAKKMALKLHSLLYGIHSVGWDMAISDEGPLFIEGNDNWEITPHQIIDGGLKRKFLEQSRPPARPV